MEFKKAVRKRRLDMREHLVREAWAVFLDFLASDHGIAENIEGLFNGADLDGNGYLDIRELASAMERFGLKIDGEKLDAFREDIDANGDHQITLGEFLAAVDKRSKQLAQVTEEV